MEPPNTNPSSSREEDLNPGPPDYKSSALTTRPRYLHAASTNVLANLSPLFSAKPKPLEDNAVQKNKTVVETASMKLSGSKPYVYFKVKSPVHISMTTKKPFNLSVSVKGLQPIKIHWHKDLYQLVIGSRYKTFDDSRRLLVEPPFTEEDSGIYSAAACNTKGCEVRGVQVMFYSKYTDINTWAKGPQWLNFTNIVLRQLKSFMLDQERLKDKKFKTESTRSSSNKWTKT